MDNNFSAQVKEIISFSREEALRLGNDFIGTEHLLLGLIRDGDNTAIKVLKQLNVDLYELRKEVELAVKDKTGKNIANINSLPLTKQAEKVIRVTVLEAKALKSPLVETEHLMLSILKNKENIATQILNQFDVDYVRWRPGSIGYGTRLGRRPRDAALRGAERHLRRWRRHHGDDHHRCEWQLSLHGLARRKLPNHRRYDDADAESLRDVRP